MDPMATLRVIWAALMASVGLFPVLVLILPPAASSPDQTHLLALGVSAAATAVMSLVLPRHVYTGAVRAAALETSEIPDPDVPAGFAEVNRVRVFMDAASARRRAVLLYQQYTILGCAMSEAVGLFGLVLNRLGHSTLTALPFMLVALLLMALRFPSQAKSSELFQHAAKARLT